MNQKTLFLENEKVGKLIKKFAIPCIISLLVGALYNIVDQIFIANASYLGSIGNAANTVVFPLTVIALAIATMLGDGCCAYLSISLGKKENDKANRSVGNAIILIVIASVIITVIYLLFSNVILNAFGANVNQETFDMAEEYFFYISLGIPFYMFGQAMNPIIRSDGSPKYAMISLLVGAITNLILDPIFIFVFKWGMMGAALATIIGQILSAILSFIYLFKMKLIKLSKHSFKLNMQINKSMIPLGITSFLSQISIVFSMAAVLNMCQKYGAKNEIFGLKEYAQIPTAVIGIVMKFFQIVISISIGLTAGCISIIGYNIGAKRFDRVKEIVKKLLIIELIIGSIALIVFECIPNTLINIFGAKNESIYYTEFAVKCIRLFLSTIMLSCFNKGTFIILQSLNKPWTSTLLSLLREIVFGVGLVLILPIWFGLNGILYFMAIADILTFIVVLIVIIKIFKNLSKQIKINNLNFQLNN